MENLVVKFSAKIRYLGLSLGQTPMVEGQGKPFINDKDFDNSKAVKVLTKLFLLRQLTRHVVGESNNI